MANDFAARMFTIRGEFVILDSDLAALYGVPTRRLNAKVRHKPQRFPMAAGSLNSKRAVEESIHTIRAFFAMQR